MQTNAFFLTYHSVQGIGILICTDQRFDVSLVSNRGTILRAHAVNVNSLVSDRGQFF